LHCRSSDQFARYAKDAPELRHADDVARSIRCILSWSLRKRRDRFTSTQRAQRVEDGRMSFAWVV